MFLTKLSQTLSGSPCRASLRSKLTKFAKPVISAGLALTAALCSGYVSAQTLVLTKTPAVTDLYSRGVVAFPSTAVGTDSAVQNLKLTVTGGALTITSITVPTSTARIQQFTVGAITGCTVNGTTSNATNTVCTVPVTFNPAYVGYQTSPLIAVTSNGTFQFGLNGVGTGPQAILMPGILSTIAGNGTVQTTATRYTGDGGQATAAQVLSHGFAFDALGNLFEAEYNASVIRKITPAGVISTVVGAETTTAGVEQSTQCTTPTTNNTCGDGAAATTANFGTNLPDIALDSAGNLYIADSIDNRIRRVDAATNIINTIAGTGSASTTGSGNTGDGGAATAAQLNTPEAVVVDNADNIYMLNSNASQQTLGAVVRFISSATGNISTLAGTGAACVGTAACGDGGQSTAAQLAVSAAFYVDPTTGNIWIADRDDDRIRFINRATGIISTVAGTGAAGYTGDGGQATAATFNGPHGIWVDPAGNIYIADRTNNVVRYVSKATGIISTIAGGGAACAAGGNGTCGDGGLSNGPLANLTPDDIRLDVNGNVYVADQANNAIRKITTSPITLTFPTVAVGTTSGPLTATLQNIGTSTLTYTTPASGTNAAISTTGPTALPSNAFAQTNATTCGPISSTSTTGNTLASGASCNFVVSFTPDTSVGNYTGTLIETDNSLNSGAGNTHYPTALTQTVNLKGAATAQTATVTLASTPNPSTYGATVALTATVGGVGVAPTGTVTFTYTPTGSTTAQTIGTGTLQTANGVTTASINYALLPVGTDNIIATYNGDANYAAGTKSATDAQVVNKASGSVDTLTANPTSTAVGSPVVLTFTVPTTTGATAPTGTVTFSNGATTLGTATIATANGVSTATLTTSALPVGTDTVTATYPGDANYGSAAPTAVETVGQAGSTVSLTTNPNPSTSGSSVTLSSTVTGGTATPTGTVSFYSVGTANTINLPATAAGASQTLSLPTGTYQVSFPGTTNGGQFAGWNSSTTPNSNNLWTDRYGVELCATCATSVVVLSGNPGYSTDTQALAAYQAATVITNGSTPVGNPYTFTLTAPQSVSFFVPDGNFANGAFTDTSSFADDSGGLSLALTPLTLIGTGTLNGSGVATTSTSTLPVGTDPVIAVYNGSGNSVSGSSPVVNQVVNPVASTNDTVTVTPNPTTYGATETLTFLIPAVAGAQVPTGTVSFTTPIGGTTTVLGASPVTINPTPVTVNGQQYYTATTTTTALPVGTDTVTGTFTPGANSGYASGAPTATVTVAKADGGNADTLTANPTTSSFGSPVVLTFTVPTIAGATASPTGTVTFTQGTTTLGTGTLTTTGTGANAVTTATLTTNSLPVGTDTVIATYPGDANYSNAAPTATETVTKATPVDTLTYSPTAPTYGAPVVLTFTIPPVAGATATPTGTVTFTNGGTQLGTGTITTVGGVTTATITTTALPVGSDTVTATYGGDTNYAAAAPTAVVPVGKADGGNVDTLTATPSPSTYGAPVLLTFNVPTVAGAVMPPTGTVTFTSGGVTLGTGTLSTIGTGANAVTTATLTTSALPVGTDTITATYPGDTNYAASAPTATETINKSPFGAPNDTLTTNPNPSTFGQTVTLTETLTTVGALAPTGSVTFFYNGTSIGTGTISGGVATITTATLPVGTDPITATYTGDGNYAAGTSGPVNQVVTQTGSTATLAVGPNPATFGTPVTLTETITPINGTCPAGPVTFLNNGTAIGTGVVSLTSNGCVASLTSSTLPVGTDQITATVPASGGFTATTSGPVPLVVNKANGVDTLASSPNPSVFGSPVTITDTIPTVGGVAPTGTVTFFDFGQQIGTGTVNAQGVATLVTSTLPVGTDSLTATYAGDANYAQVTAGPVNQVVTQVPTGPTLSVAPNPTTFGTTVTLQETIPVTNGTAATGQVLFYQNGTLVGAGTLVNGVATITTSTLPVGTDPITATYAGDTNYAAANSGPVNEVINKANGPDTLAVSPDPAVFGSTVTMTDTIPTVGGVAPTGTVTFYNNGTAIGTSPVSTSGVATLTSTTLPVGTDPITAIYSGDNNYATVTTGPVNEVITVGNPPAGLAANPNPSTFGTPVTLTESITGINGVSPTGTVTFSYNGTVIGTAPVTNGVATVVTSTLPIGTDPVTAAYTGDSNYAPVNSGPLNVVVNRSALADTLTALPSPSNFGSPVTLTFTVTPVNGVAPTGVVTFYNGATSIGTGTVNAQGVATLTTSTLPVGTDTITAKYPGDNSYAPASPTATVVINQAPPTVTLVAGPNPATYGTPVTLTETITSINGTCPAGPVTFLNNGVSIGTGTISNATGSCVATLTTSTLPVGTDQITATVPASGGFVATTSGPVALVINKASGADTLASSPNPSVFGSPVTITDTIPTVNGVAPTGIVTFFDFGVQIGTGTVNAQGVATLVTSTLPVGTDSLTATYSGDANYAQVTAGPVNQVVTAVPTSPTLAVGPNPTTFGTTVTFVETIPIVNNTPATGTVSFSQHGILVGTGTLANGVATITTSTLPVGTDPITATYAGDTNYSAVNSGPVNEVVNKAIGATTLTVNPDPSPFGDPVTMTDTIPTVGGVAPTGTVTFYNNGASIGTGTVNAQGVGTLVSTTLPVGSDPITAIYSGDNNYATSTAGPVNEIITQKGVGPVLSATPNPANFGTTVTLTESIPGVNGVSPTGTVIFFNNGVAIGTAPLTNGVATLPTSTLPIGTDPITATYSGDTNYATANSGPLNVVINKTPSADTLTVTPNPSVFGSPVTITFTVPPVNGVVPTGTVQFFDGTTLIGTGTVNAQGVATLTTSQLPNGTSTVTAKYPGDNTYAPASPTATVTVNPVSPTSVVTVPTGSPICGSSVTLTDTITLVNGVALGGTVQFYDNGTAIGSPVPVPASGVVTLTTTALACTTDVITAIYTPPANSPYLPSTGGPTTIVVNSPDFSIAATPPNQTVNPGDSATYTVSLSGVVIPFTSPVQLTATGLPPGATVTFGNSLYTPGQGPTSTTMTIVTAPNQAVLKHSTGSNGIYYGLLLLPLLGLGKVRRKIKALPKGITYCLAALIMLGGLGAMTGCGGGYFGPAPQTFTITVTGTSGTLVHSTTVTLTVR